MVSESMVVPFQWMDAGYRIGQHMIDELYWKRNHLLFQIPAHIVVTDFKSHDHHSRSTMIHSIIHALYCARCADPCGNRYAVVSKSYW